MELTGTITRNLRYAIRSAERHRGRQVHPDTLQYWQDLLDQARQEKRRGKKVGRWTIDGLINQLETEIADRQPRETNPKLDSR